MVFWYQLVACYGTRLHFETDFTMDQGESAKSLQATFSDNDVKRNAAHSSTFPSLKACSMREWKKHQNEKIDKPTMFSFLKGSDLYNLSNSTYSIIKEVNDADIKIDGRKHDSRFSKKALDLLNQASIGKISPENAIYEFLDSAISITRSRLKDTTDNEGVNEALKIYLNEFKEHITTLNNNPEWVYQYLDLHTLKDNSARMKATTLKLRSYAIRNNFLGQTQMDRMIETQKKKIFARVRANTEKMPPSIEKAFTYLLIDQMPSLADKKRMRKFFAIPPLEYQDKLRNGVARITKAMTELHTEIPKIKALAKDLSKHMLSMRRAQINDRGKTLEAIRVAKGMTRPDLSKIMQETFPHEPGSVSTIRRDEIGERTITLPHAKKLSKALDVPIGFLVEQFFNR
jgi:hypothetical protein